MGVQITVRQLTDHDVQVLSSNNPFTELRTFTLDTPKYQVIKQHHTGLLSPDSPVQGLCTDTVASGLAIIFHCPSTRRSCLIHTPTSFKVAMWASQLAYVADSPIESVIGEEEEEAEVEDSTESTSTSSRLRNVKLPPVEVEVIVLKGSQRRKSRLDHAETIGALEGGLKELSKSLNSNINISFTYPSQKLTSGGVSLDKDTGRIEIFLLPDYLGRTQIALGSIDLAEFDQFNKRTSTLLALSSAGGGEVLTESFGRALGGRVLSN